MTAKYTSETLKALHDGQALAQKIHTQIVVPDNPPLDVRMFAIAVLAAEVAVTNSDTIDKAKKIVSTIMDTANSAVFVLGPYSGGEFSTGIDTPKLFARLPQGYSGGIWTNEIETIARIAGKSKD